jgi:hypothetical protein
MAVSGVLAVTIAPQLFQSIARAFDGLMSGLTGDWPIHFR